MKDITFDIEANGRRRGKGHCINDVLMRTPISLFSPLSFPDSLSNWILFLATQAVEMIRRCLSMEKKSNRFSWELIDILKEPSASLSLMSIYRDKFPQIFLVIFDLTCRNFFSPLYLFSPRASSTATFFYCFLNGCIKNVNLFAFDSHDKSNFEREK